MGHWQPFLVSLTEFAEVYIIMLCQYFIVYMMAMEVYLINNDFDLSNCVKQQMVNNKHVCY